MSVGVFFFFSLRFLAYFSKFGPLKLYRRGPFPNSACLPRGFFFFFSSLDMHAWASGAAVVQRRFCKAAAVWLSRRPPA